MILNDDDLKKLQFKKDNVAVRKAKITNMSIYITQQNIYKMHNVNLKIYFI